MATTIRERSIWADRSELAFREARPNVDPNVLAPRMVQTSLHAFGAFVTDEGWSIDKADPQTTTTRLPGMSGVLDSTLEDMNLHAYVGRRTVTIHIATVGDVDEIMETKRRIGAMHGQRQRITGLVPQGAMIGRLEVGAWEDIVGPYGIVGSECELTLDANPYAYGSQEVFQLALGERRIIAPKGNMPTPLRVSGMAGTEGFVLSVLCMASDPLFPAGRKRVKDSMSRLGYFDQCLTLPLASGETVEVYDDGEVLASGSRYIPPLNSTTPWLYPEKAIIHFQSGLDGKSVELAYTPRYYV